VKVLAEQHDDKSGLTRAQYRKQQEKESESFQERDRKRIQVEKEYARTHRDDPTSESFRAHQELTETKVARLKHRLNWLIFYLILGIIIVFLILFFVD